MDSEHRHELKRNDLAQWIAQMPKHIENAPQYLKSHWFEAICVILIIVGAGMWLFKDNQTVVVHDIGSQIELTQLYQAQMKVKGNALAGKEDSTLLDNSDQLVAVASGVGRETNASLALIKAGDALRSDLHYKKGQVDDATITAQIGEAKLRYEEALSKAGSNKTLAALAAFGVAICGEEVRDFDAAAAGYQAIIDNAQYQATFVVILAEGRLSTLEDAKVKYAFKYVEPKIEQAPAIDAVETK